MNNPTSTPQKKHPGFAVAAGLLAIAGVVVSIILTNIHYQTHTNVDYHSVCAVNDTINCESVARSPYAVFIGLPVAVWGLFGYLVALILSVVAWRAKKMSANGLLFFTGLCFCAAAIALGLISHLIIKAICLFCVSLYVINLLFFGVTAAGLIRTRTNPFKQLVTDLKNLVSIPKITLPALALTVLVPALTMALIPPYWKQLGWSDIQTMDQGITKDGHHWIGAKKPLVTVVEYSDYQCPFCRRAHKRTRLMMNKYKNQVRLVHRHFPMDQACNDNIKQILHEYACKFAKAVECAGQQEKFWQMNDALFSIQDSMTASEVDVRLLAQGVGLEIKQFDDCMASTAVIGTIRADIRKGVAQGVAGTPTYFIGPQPYPGGLLPDTLDKWIKVATDNGKPQNTR